MVGQATKYYLSAAVLGALAAMVYALPAYRFFGTIVLAAAGLVFIVLFAMSVSSGDPASGDREIEHRRPTSNAWWPVMTAFGFALLVLGLVVDPVYAYGGILLIVLSAVEWTVSAWADRHSDDPVANKLERDRLMRPIEVPVFAVLAIAVPVFLLSRLLLAISVDAAAYVAIGISVLVLGVAFILYAWSGVRREILTAVLAIGGIAILVGGVVAMANGERDFEHHVDESAEEAPEGDEGTATDPATGAEGGEEGSNPATEPGEEGGEPEAEGSDTGGGTEAEDGTETTEADTETTDGDTGGGTETTDAGTGTDTTEGEAVAGARAAA